jgi:hypothetical protein
MVAVPVVGAENVVWALVALGLNVTEAGVTDPNGTLVSSTFTGAVMLARSACFSTYLPEASSRAE